MAAAEEGLLWLMVSVLTFTANSASSENGCHMGTASVRCKKSVARIEFQSTISLLHATYSQNSELLMVKANLCQIRVSGLQEGVGGLDLGLLLARKYSKLMMCLIPR